MLNQDAHDFSNRLFEKLSDLGHWEPMVDEQVANRECSLSASIERDRIRRKVKPTNQDVEPFPIPVGLMPGRRVQHRSPPYGTILIKLAMVFPRSGSLVKAWECPLAIGCQRFGVKTLPRYLFKKHLNRQTGGLE